MENRITFEKNKNEVCVKWANGALSVRFNDVLDEYRRTIGESEFVKRSLESVPSEYHEEIVTYFKNIGWITSDNDYANKNYQLEYESDILPDLYGSVPEVNEAEKIRFQFVASKEAFIRQASDLDDNMRKKVLDTYESLKKDNSARFWIDEFKNYRRSMFDKLVYYVTWKEQYKIWLSKREETLKSSCVEKLINKGLFDEEFIPSNINMPKKDDWQGKRKRRKKF